MFGKISILWITTAHLLEARELTLTRFEDSDTHELVCNDGSGGGYYTLLSPEQSSQVAKNRWIFYLQGGGWCYDNSTCKSRLEGNQWGTGTLVSSKNWPKTREVSGIFDLRDEDWYNANLVFVPYCSSDAHMGDSDHQVDGFGLQHFRGRRMARAAVEELVGDKPDQEILFGGTSAGGRGSMVLIDFIHDLVHDTTTIRGVHDSGAYQDILPYVSSYTPFGEQCKRAFDMYTPPVSEICREEFPGELWKCICGEYMLPRVITPSQVLIYLYDSYQLSNAVGRSPAYWDSEMCRYVEDFFRSGMEETVADIVSNPQHVVFAPACYDHGIMTSTKFQSIKVEGISAEDQLLTWLSGFKEDVMSSCAGVNCEGTCQHVDVGDDALC